MPEFRKKFLALAVCSALFLTKSAPINAQSSDISVFRRLKSTDVVGGQTQWETTADGLLKEKAMFKCPDGKRIDITLLGLWSRQNNEPKLSSLATVEVVDSSGQITNMHEGVDVGVMATFTLFDGDDVNCRVAITAFDEPETFGDEVTVIDSQRRVVRTTFKALGFNPYIRTP
ncbi:hypothetical protein HY310_03375 [Candidatus Microgenomates bacterium]|nr:hypothetical protein [Candidatus Microgenomates bacterium]